MRVLDQMHRTVEIPDNIQRIVSLVPSQTELLVHLGLGDKLVGATKFCIHPKGFKESITVVGGTKNFNFNKIKSLNPDLIIGNKEENYKEGIEELAKDFSVWMSDIYSVDDALKMIAELGKITDTEIIAKNLIENIEIELSKITPKPIKKVLYFIWKNPYMVVGKNNYINSMLKLRGYQNICDSDSFSRYPEIIIEKIKELQPEVILLSSEPFPFKEKHLEEFQSFLPNSEVKIVDGELYSWYGSRILKALKTFDYGD